MKLKGPYPGLILSSEDPFSTRRKPCILTVVQTLVQERKECSERVFEGIPCCSYRNNQVLSSTSRGC